MGLLVPWVLCFTITKLTASLSVILSSHSSSLNLAYSTTNGQDTPSSSSLSSSFFVGTRHRRSFLSLSSSNPLRTRLLLHHHCSLDHLALVHAYSSLARRSKPSSSQSLSTFKDHFSSSQLASKISSSSNLDDDSLCLLEKEAKDKIKTARQIITESKESFDTQLKIQKLRDTIFAVNEQLNKAKKLGSMSSQIAAGSTPKSIHCLNVRLMGDWINNPK